MKRHFIVIGCMILGLLVSAQIAAAQTRYDYELAYGYSGRDSGYRSAVDMDDWLERGHASVAESPLFPEGIRLIALASETGGTYEPGLASAIYYFTIPRWAPYLKISIRYKDTARDDEAAGRLWIKSTEKTIRGTTEAGEEAPFYGDTFVLRSGRESETILVPASRHVEDNTIELHIVVDGNDSIDVRDIRLEYLNTQPRITVVHRTPDNYWNQRPRYRHSYHYYYWGPLFWPRTYIVYECWDVPIRFYWATWRPWFFVNIVRVHHHHSWWAPRRYTVSYHNDVKHPPSERRRLLHERLRERHKHENLASPVLSPPRATAHSTVQHHQSQQQEIRLKEEIDKSRTPEKTINQNQTMRKQKEQSVREYRQQEKTMLQAQIKTNNQQAVNEPYHHPTPPAQTSPQRTQKGQAQSHAVEPQLRSIPAARVAVQVPANVHTPRDDGSTQEQTAQGPANIGQATMSQPRQNVHQARSSGGGKDR